jgi:hypothetical protein
MTNIECKIKSINEEYRLQNSKPSMKSTDCKVQIAKLKTNIQKNSKYFRLKDFILHFAFYIL